MMGRYDQQVLGERAGLTGVQLSRIESGLVGPRLVTRRELAAALDVDLTAIDWPGSDRAIGACASSTVLRMPSSSWSRS
jgi:transcriptional regulator with XRE-family HTH domain